MTAITIRRPDDWHVHFRDGAMLRTVVPFTARHFGRAIVMPNLVPPVTTAAAAAAYRERILAAVPAGARFTPLMTAYLTEATDPADLVAGHRDGVLTAAKLYPAHATTNSQFGVSSIAAIREVLAAMERAGMPLLVHGEVTDPAIDIFDREAVFIDRVLAPLLREHEGLKVVMEHITTREGADFVRAHAPRLGATITPQHLMLNRNALLVGGIRPHYYCLPVLKRGLHQEALRNAATGGEACFFLGTDTAPHMKHLKENACGCAGVFSAPVALACYAQVFAEEGALERLEAFASLNGPAFYGLPPNEERITLAEAEAAPVPPLPVGAEGELVTFEPPRLGWAVISA
ncbi:dihydroorotase [Propylenella binzhouense]|nr:dihydroorotase [Propylenella binzhouense]